jgi:gamma-glutamyltranspeptidase/glutathione hydrolase
MNDGLPEAAFSRREFLIASGALAGAALLPLGTAGNSYAAPGKLAHSTRGMVTSPHSLASEAGLEVLKRGGTAVEALIAVGSTLCVTYPHFTGLGGDAFWVLSDKAGNVHTISGIGQAAMQYPDYQGSIPVRGPGSMLTTAATVDTWDRAYRYSKERWGGKQDWEKLFRRSVEYAEKGFPVTPSQRFWQDFRAKDVANWPGFSNIFMPKGRLLESGELLRQPQLARTLESLARDGARGFYEGRLSQRIAAGLKHVPQRAKDLHCASPTGTASYWVLHHRHKGSPRSRSWAFWIASRCLRLQKAVPTTTTCWSRP